MGRSWSSCCWRPATRRGSAPRCRSAARVGSAAGRRAAPRRWSDSRGRPASGRGPAGWRGSPSGCCAGDCRWWCRSRGAGQYRYRCAALDGSRYSARYIADDNSSGAAVAAAGAQSDAGPWSDAHTDSDAADKWPAAIRSAAIRSADAAAATRYRVLYLHDHAAAANAAAVGTVKIFSKLAVWNRADVFPTDDATYAGMASNAHDC